MTAYSVFGFGWGKQRLLLRLNPGDRIELISEVERESGRRLLPGWKGTVTFIMEPGPYGRRRQIDVRWDDLRASRLITEPPDQFEIITHKPKS